MSIYLPYGGKTDKKEKGGRGEKKGMSKRSWRSKVSRLHLHARKRSISIRGSPLFSPRSSVQRTVFHQPKRCRRTGNAFGNLARSFAKKPMGGKAFDRGMVTFNCPQSLVAL